MAIEVPKNEEISGGGKNEGREEWRERWNRFCHLLGRSK